MRLQLSFKSKLKKNYELKILFELSLQAIVFSQLNIYNLTLYLKIKNLLKNCFKI